MATEFNDLVWETTTQTASPFTLTAVAQTFNTAFGTGGTDLFDFFMYNRSVPGEWMHATGHLSDASTLVLDTVIDGSNGTSAVAWSAGTKDISNAIPTNMVIYAGKNNTIDDINLIVAQLALANAKALGAAQLLGGTGNRFADNFDTLDYVDTAGATALDTSESGVLKPTLTTTLAASSYIGDMTSNGGLAAAFDGTTSQGTTEGASSASTAASTFVYVGADYSAAPKVVGSVDVYGSNNAGFVSSSNPTVTLRLYGKNSGAPSSSTDGTQLGTASFTDTADESAGRTITNGGSIGPWDYLWIAVSHDDGTSRFMRVAEVEFKGPAAMVVASEIQVAASAPTDVHLVAQIEKVTTVTVNTDLIFAASRDGGANWTNATMNERTTHEGITLLESDDIDVSGQPSDTDMMWRITTANNKMVEIHGVYLYWS